MTDIVQQILGAFGISNANAAEPFPTAANMPQARNPNAPAHPGPVAEPGPVLHPAAAAKNRGMPNPVGPGQPAYESITRNFPTLAQTRAASQDPTVGGTFSEDYLAKIMAARNAPAKPLPVSSPPVVARPAAAPMEQQEGGVTGLNPANSRQNALDQLIQQVRK